MLSLGVLQLCDCRSMWASRSLSQALWKPPGRPQGRLPRRPPRRRPGKPPGRSPGRPQGSPQGSSQGGPQGGPTGRPPGSPNQTSNLNMSLPLLNLVQCGTAHAAASGAPATAAIARPACRSRRARCSRPETRASCPICAGLAGRTMAAAAGRPAAVPESGGPACRSALAAAAAGVGLVVVVFGASYVHKQLSIYTHIVKTHSPPLKGGWGVDPKP